MHFLKIYSFSGHGPLSKAYLYFRFVPCAENTDGAVQFFLGRSFAWLVMWRSVFAYRLNYCLPPSLPCVVLGGYHLLKCLLYPSLIGRTWLLSTRYTTTSSAKEGLELETTSPRYLSSMTAPMYPNKPINCRSWLPVHSIKKTSRIPDPIDVQLQSVWSFPISLELLSEVNTRSMLHKQCNSRRPGRYGCKHAACKTSYKMCMTLPIFLDMGPESRDLQHSVNSRLRVPRNFLVQRIHYL